MIKMIIFDLDDTLYLEKQFVMSGFKAISKYLSRKYKKNPKELFKILMKDYDHGLRKKNFNELLKKTNLKQERIGNLVKIYREHEPEISLCEDVIEPLKELGKKYKLILITDGYKKCQENKIDKLGIRKFFDLIIINKKKDLQKPSKASFSKGINKFGFRPNEVVHVADNPMKDFVNTKKMGIHTVRIRRKEGECFHLKLGKEQEADFNISNLSELENAINRIDKKIFREKIIWILKNPRLFIKRKIYLKKIIKNNKVLFKYKGVLYPEHITKPGRVRYISSIAKKYCKGKGLDIGAGTESFLNAIAIENEKHQNAYKLDRFKDASLDYIFSSHTLEHLNKWKQALKLWISKLKREGILFLYLPHESMALWLPGGLWVGKGHKWKPMPNVLIGFLEKHGMDVIKYTKDRDKYYSFYIIAKKL